MQYHVVYICDERYAMPTLVSAVSVIRAMQGKPMNIHIVAVDLSEQSLARVERLKRSETHVTIHRVEIADLQDKLERISQKTHVTPTSLLKFELPQILWDVDRVLYLDSDIIAKGDLEPLFRMEFKEYYAACAQELWRVVHANGTDTAYYNSGVLLMNLKLMRGDHVSERLWKEKLRLSEEPSSRTMDQDALNNVLGDRIRLLDILYNLNPYFVQPRFLKLVAHYSQETFSTVRELEEKARIIHYVGKEDKPWIYENARMVSYWDICWSALGEDPSTLRRKRYRRDINSLAALIQKYWKKYGILAFFRRGAYRL